jgi:uncharacterized protein (DUF58 family)
LPEGDFNLAECHPLGDLHSESGNESRPEERDTMMKPNPLPKDADELVALAEGIATVLSEKRDALGFSGDLESLLHASIAYATFSIDTYLEALARAGKSPAAVSHLASRRARCYRCVERLRRRVTRCIAELCRHMDGEELRRVALYVTKRSLAANCANCAN